MRAFGFLLIVILAIVDLASSQVTDVPSSKKGDLPMYRPALLGGGPNSLINRIDTQDLIKKGQKDAAIMFNCSVRKTGAVEWSGTYRGTPDSKMPPPPTWAGQNLFLRSGTASRLPLMSRFRCFINHQTSKRLPGCAS